jgi:hypothetical protein
MISIQITGLILTSTIILRSRVPKANAIFHATVSGHVRRVCNGAHVVFESDKFNHALKCDWKTLSGPPPRHSFSVLVNWVKHPIAQKNLDI